MKTQHLVVLVIGIMGLATSAIADIPHVITYQGRVIDSLGVPLDGEHQMTFSIYTMPESGDVLWTSGPRTIPVDGGLFTCDLGMVTPIPDSVFHQHFERWLGISIDGGPELTPRTIFNSVAFSYRAQLADWAIMSELAGEAEYAMFADTSLHAFNGDHADDADHAKYADTAGYAYAAPGGGFTLPYYGLAATTDPAFSVANDGTGPGIRGQSAAKDGVVGYTDALDKSGIYGYSPAGAGVTGRAEGNNHGVVGKTVSTDTLFAGVSAEGPMRGLIARATDSGGIAGHFIGDRTGIKTVLEPDYEGYYSGQYTTIDADAASSDNASYFGEMIRIFGEGTDVCVGSDAIADGGRVNYGVNAEASNVYYPVSQAVNYGVHSKAAAGYINVGVSSMAQGSSSDSLTVGVEGMGVNGAHNYGGLFYATGADTNYGIYAEAVGGDLNYGVYAKTGTGAGKWAGYFVGDIEVTRYVFGVAKFFKIDHPLDPENKYLIHSCVESPDQMNVYNGNVITDAHGRATVTLPDYFEALNRDFRYQLTVIGEFAQAIISEEISDNQFGILTDKPYIKVSWQVTGIRSDASARSRTIHVETDKPESERGRYLDPEAFGLGEEFGIHYQNHLRRHDDRQSGLIDQHLDMQGRRKRSE